MAANLACAVSESVLSNFKILRRHFRVAPPNLALTAAAPPVRFLRIAVPFVLPKYSEKQYQIQAPPVKELSIFQTEAASEDGGRDVDWASDESVEGGAASSPSARQRA
jgi:hypothetical protein